MSNILLYLVFLFAVVAARRYRLYLDRGIRMPISGGTYDFDFIYNYTKFLHGIYRFNSFVTFSRKTTRYRPTILVERSFEQALVEDFNVPIIVWGMQRNAKLRNNIGLNNLVFVQISSINDPILDVVDKTLDGLHFISMLFFFKDKYNLTPTSGDILKFFEWCWSKNMINIALVFQIVKKHRVGKIVFTDIYDHVYSYSPFPKLTVLNLTDELKKGGGCFAIDRVKNVHGYTFKTPLFHFPPHVFLAPTARNCKPHLDCFKVISGTSGRLFKEYINFIHGKVDVIEYKNLTINDKVNKVLLAAAKKEVDIGIHPITDLLLDPEMSEGSYPIGQSNFCIIVPFRREIPYEYYFVHSLSLAIWVLVGLMCVALLVLQFLATLKSTGVSQNPLALCGSAIVAVAGLLLDKPYKNAFLQARSSYYKFIHLVILIMTFVLSNMYTVSLTSLLTTAPLGEQINTIDQFLSSGLEIMMPSGETGLLFENNHLPSQLKKRLHFVSEEIHSKHFHSLNTSYAYIATAIQWQVISYQQRHLIKPLFHMPSKELCTSEFFLKFPVQFDSPFTLSLALFFMSTQESGFSLKWRDLSIYEAMKIDNIESIQGDAKFWKPLSIRHFYLAGQIVLVNWVLASICFLGEIFYYYFTKARRVPKGMNSNQQYEYRKRLIKKRAGKFYKGASKKYGQKRLDNFH